MFSNLVGHAKCPHTRGVGMAVARSFPSRANACIESRSGNFSVTRRKGFYIIKWKVAGMELLRVSEAKKCLEKLFFRSFVNRYIHWYNLYDLYVKDSVHDHLILSLIRTLEIHPVLMEKNWTLAKTVPMLLGAENCLFALFLQPVNSFKGSHRAVEDYRVEKHLCQGDFLPDSQNFLVNSGDTQTWLWRTL